MAKKAQDAYVMLLRELDKYESPSFRVSDFQYFFNSGINEYISNHLTDADVLQKDSDDIDSFITWNESLTQDNTDKSKFTLPSLYRHVWSVKVTVKWLVAWGKYKVDDEITIYPKRRRSTREGFQEKNAYHKPDTEYPTYKIEGGFIYILAGDKVEPLTVRLDYIPQPTDIGLTEDLVTNDDIPFPDYVLREIVKLTRRIFLENIESGRYSSTLQEEQLRNE